MSIVKPFLNFCNIRLFLFVLIMVPSLSWAQVSFNSESLEEDFTQNLNLYSNAYLDPALSAFGANLVNGFYFKSSNSLAPFRFRVGLFTSAARIPENQQSFDFNQQPFTSRLRLAAGNSPNLPTVFGGEASQTLIYRVEGTINPLGAPVSYDQELDAFSGIRLPMDFYPNAMPQVAMGLPLHFQVVARGLPRIRFQGVDVFQLGFGIQNELSAFFLEDSPFHLLVGTAYSLSNFSYQPDDFFQGDNQEIAFRGSALQLDLNASYDFKFIEVYGRMGWYSSITDFAINGSYRFETDQSTPVADAPLVDQTAFEVEDPVDLNRTTNGLVFSVGGRIPVGNFFSVGAGVNFARYTSLDASFCFEFGQNE